MPTKKEELDLLYKEALELYIKAMKIWINANGGSSIGAFETTPPNGPPNPPGHP